jgi:hypothetical protein
MAVPKHGPNIHIQSSINNDAYQQRIVNVSQTGTVTGNNNVNTGSISEENVVLDPEAVNLLNWFAHQQGVDRQTALKKALAIASYIYDLTSQGNKLLVQRPDKDKSIGEIILK